MVDHGIVRAPHGIAALAHEARRAWTPKVHFGNAIKAFHIDRGALLAEHFPCRDTVQLIAMSEGRVTCEYDDGLDPLRSARGVGVARML